MRPRHGLDRTLLLERPSVVMKPAVSELHNIMVRSTHKVDIMVDRYVCRIKESSVLIIRRISRVTVDQYIQNTYNMILV
jgi:hypothetical protein